MNSELRQAAGTMFSQTVAGRNPRNNKAVYKILHRFF